jgi:hypothetical protein
MDSTCSTREEARNAFKILDEQSQRNIKSRRTRSRWEDNIKIALREIGCQDVN